MANRWRPLSPGEAAAVAAGGGLLVVHFWAPWNGIDWRFARDLAPLSEHFGGRAVFRSANVDDPEVQPLMGPCGVVNVPTVAGLFGGACVGRLVGVYPAHDLAVFVAAWVRRAPRAIDPRWRTADVVGVARGIAADGALDRLPILADALMDAGCANEGVLGLCRAAGPAGWWVVDLVLGRS